MKEALINIVSALSQQSAFLIQVAADVCALKTVVEALGPEAKAALDEQVAAERDRFQKQCEVQQKILEALRVAVSRMPN